MEKKEMGREEQGSSLICLLSTVCCSSASTRRNSKIVSMVRTYTVPVVKRGHLAPGKVSQHILPQSCNGCMGDCETRGVMENSSYLWGGRSCLQVVGGVVQVESELLKVSGYDP